MTLVHADRFSASLFSTFRIRSYVYSSVMVNQQASPPCAGFSFVRNVRCCLPPISVTLESNAGRSLRTWTLIHTSSPLSSYTRRPTYSNGRSDVGRRLRSSLCSVVNPYPGVAFPGLWMDASKFGASESGICATSWDIVEDIAVILGVMVVRC